MKSVKRESNLQFLLGKEMGYHYTMDAFCWLNQIVKDRIRLQESEDFLKPDTCYFSGIGGYRTHIGRFKRPVHYHVCHNPICVSLRIGVEGSEPSTLVL